MPLQRNRPSQHGNLGKGDLGKGDLGKGDLGKPDKAFVNNLVGQNDSWKY